MNSIEIKTNTPELDHPYWMALLTQQIEEKYSMFALKVMVSFVIKDFNNGKIKSQEAISDLRKLYKQNLQCIPDLEKNITIAENSPAIEVGLEQKLDNIEKEIFNEIEISEKSKENWFSGFINFFKRKK